MHILALEFSVVLRRQVALRRYEVETTSASDHGAWPLWHIEEQTLVLANGKSFWNCRACRKGGAS